MDNYNYNDDNDLTKKTLKRFLIKRNTVIKNNSRIQELVRRSSDLFEEKKYRDLSASSSIGNTDKYDYFQEEEQQKNKKEIINNNKIENELVERSRGIERIDGKMDNTTTNNNIKINSIDGYQDQQEFNIERVNMVKHVLNKTVAKKLISQSLSSNSKLNSISHLNSNNNTQEEDRQQDEETMREIGISPQSIILNSKTRKAFDESHLKHFPNHEELKDKKAWSEKLPDKLQKMWKEDETSNEKYVSVNNKVREINDIIIDSNTATTSSSYESEPQASQIVSTTSILSEISEIPYRSIHPHKFFPNDHEDLKKAVLIKGTVEKLIGVHDEKSRTSNGKPPALSLQELPSSTFPIDSTNTNIDSYSNSTNDNTSRRTTAWDIFDNELKSRKSSADNLSSLEEKNQCYQMKPTAKGDLDKLDIDIKSLVDNFNHMKEKYHT